MIEENSSWSPLSLPLDILPCLYSPFQVLITIFTKKAELEHRACEALS